MNTQPVSAKPAPEAGSIAIGGGRAEYVISRGAGHPWNGAEGWDMLEARCEGDGTLDGLRSAVGRKFWKEWFEGQDGEGRQVAVFFKPSGATADWDDPYVPNAAGAGQAGQRGR